jgi:hypothetical protein
MTEVFEKFICSVPTSYCGGDWIQTPENVLRAFVQEVERILKDVSDRTNIGSAKAMRTTWKVEIFENLVREFGLDGEGK